LSLYDTFSAGRDTMLDAIMLMLVVITFLLAGGHANRCNNLLAPSDDDADRSLSS
jgi:hypothetical protein